MVAPFLAFFGIFCLFLPFSACRYSRLLTVIVAPGSMPWAYSFRAEMRVIRLSSV
jgi:hypothetical protein